MGIPEKAVREGIERCYTAVDPRRRAKRPVFLCFREIMESHETLMRIELQKRGIDWRHRFWQKIRLVESFAGDEVREPSSEEEAQKILKKIEARMVQSFWERMDPSQRKRGYTACPIYPSTWTDSAVSTAFIRALALLRVSSHSRWGTESATMPAPA